MIGLRRMLGPGTSRSVIAAAALGVVGVAVGMAWAGGTTTVEPSVDRAKTLTFAADDARHRLFRVGDTRLTTRCDIVGDPKSPEFGGIARQIGVKAGSQGAVVVVPEGFAEVAPGDSDVLLLDAVPPDGVDPGLITFAVFDGGGASASGTAALLADPPNEKCTTTAQVAG